MAREANISRRSLLKMGGAAAAGAVGAGALGSIALADEAAEPSWDKEADLVILGSGAGGLSAAITAAQEDPDAAILVLEKAPEEDQGGNTRVAGNMWTCPTDLEEGLKYYKAASERTRDDEYLEALATSAYTLNDDFVSKLPDADIQLFGLFAPEFDALPGGDAIQDYMNHASGNGQLWEALLAGAQQYANVEFVYKTPGKRLITNAAGEVIGVVAESEGKEINVKAKRGVVIATGGYEFNENMIENSYPGWPVFSRGTPYNTGDGIMMAQKVGAALWHMNASDSGCGAVLCPGLNFGGDNYDSDKVPANLQLGKASKSNNGFIAVDKHGARFMPEDRADGHGYGRREYLFFYDGVKCEWPHLPYWTVFDAEQAQRPVASGKAEGSQFTWFTAHSGYEWSQDNSAEVERGWVLKADTLEDLAAQMNGVEAGEGKMDAATLQATVDAYNKDAEAGEDTQFGRAAETMRPLTGPFYAVLCYPNQYNTQGGPKRNTRAQTLDAFDEPIPRLYSVGECGAGYGWVYNGGWNIAEAMVTGIWAGKDAIKLEPWA
ncbi:MAG: FAD-binding protein [Coriobacteriia bacterium]|nr:FAD-binding protein [Coriobacteriia bacterium]MBS5478649.1 FAD-binding protein [Coriobacteriia bacterium]